MTRYHPALVALHWGLAVLILGGLAAGGLVLAETPNDDPGKIFTLGVHMSVGLVILLLMLARLVVRFRTPHPPQADIGAPLLNRLGGLTHGALYLLVFVMCASGIGISILAGLGPIVFGGSGAPLPADFSVYTPRIVHGYAATLLGLLIAAHVAAALYHQFGRRDGLFARMWFGPRT